MATTVIKKINHNMIRCKKCRSKTNKKLVVDYLQIFIEPRKFKCENCVVEEFKQLYYGNTYGFRENKEEIYSLNTFKAKAANFKKKFLKNAKNTDPFQIDELFWDIVSDHTHDIEVEYGSDLATSQVGSGFPTLKNNQNMNVSQKKYATSYWNLNNLPNHSKSPLSYINSDISGIKVPWMYVGMLFSSFCWHVEDHWACSINYNHIGDIKTWYGIPESDADKFETLFRTEYSELFENQNDLTHQLVTTINPDTIKAAGIEIYKLHQGAGEYVITFSRSYHAGFNHGFNVAEATNFCFNEWIDVGRKAVISYQKDQRTPVFSHDALIIEIAYQLLQQQLQQNHLESSSNQFNKRFVPHPSKQMISTEFISNTKQQLSDMKKRVKYLEKSCPLEWFNPDNEKSFNFLNERTKINHFKDNSKDIICSKCKTICHVGYIICDNHSIRKYSCELHMQDICKCDKAYKAK